MAKKCFKYRGNTYTSEELFQKIRRNAEQFAKRHKISGSEIARAAEKDINFSLLTESDFDADGNVKPVVIAEIKAERERIKSEAQANGTWMKAPNGADTNLNEQQWVDVRTKRFTDWFGDWQNDPENASKVVDDNGEPLVVYHGTNSSTDNFTEFRFRTGEYANNQIFFTPDRNYAQSIAPKDGIIMDVFLNIKTPIQDADLDLFEYARDYVDYVDNMRNEGYDGALSEDGEQISVFSPNQIKSVTSNAGTYSSGTNNINFNIIGEQGAKNAENKRNWISSLESARKMEAQGESSKAIRASTGWWKGADNKWKMETNYDISIKNINLDGLKDGEFKTMKLSDVVDFPSVFDAYPNMMDYEVRVYNGMKGNANASFDAYNNTLYINGNTKSNNQYTESIVHEIQHAIQEVEGFANGNSNEWYQRQVKQLVARSGQESLADTSLARQERIAQKAYGKNWRERLSKGEITEQDIDDVLYYSTASEIESYNAQERSLMSPEQRALIEPDLSDVNTTDATLITRREGRGDTYIINSRINQQTPLPHKNTIPYKTLEDVVDTLASQGLESAENVLKASSWYNNLSDTRKQEIEREGLVVAMQNESRKIVENAKVKQKNAVLIEKAKSKEKTNDTQIIARERIAKLRENKNEKIKQSIQQGRDSVKKLRDAKNKRIEINRVKSIEKLNEIKTNFRERIKKINESNKEYRAKVKERKLAVREAVNDIKSFLVSNKIDGNATPTEINRLIKLASQISQRRDTSKAIDEFYLEYLKVQLKAEDRKMKNENRTLTYAEFEDLETIVTDQLSQGVSQSDIEQFVKLMDLPFSKAGTLSDAIKSEIEKIKNRYETNQLTPEQKLEKSREAERRSNEVLKNKNKNWARDLKRKLITNFTDRQFLAKYLSAKLGMINTYNRIIVASGASSAANLQFEQARNKIFKGLTVEERRNLDILINRRRIVAIEENRKQRGLAPINNTDGFSLESSKEAIEAMKNDIGDAAFNKINQRADSYFSEFKSILDAMLKNGIISNAQYDAMINVDYQPRLFIEHLLDADGRLMDDESDKFANESGGLKKDMLQGLSDGSIGDQIMNAEWILRLALASRNRQMAQNEINRTFMTRDFPEAQAKYDNLKSKTEPLTKAEKRFVKYFEELSAKVKDNPVTGVNKNGNPEYKYDKTPSGFKKAYYFQDGVRHEFFMETELHKQFHDAVKGELTHATKEAIAKGSGSRIIKFFATGANPAFPIVNTPRDFLQTITFSKEYSDFMPKSTVQLIKDATNGIKELIKNDLGKESLYDKYIQYGGGMDFLHTQGMVKRDNVVMEAAEKVISPAFRDKALTGWNGLTLKKLSRYSEVMFRLAIFHRSLTNQLKEFNKVNGTNYTDIEQIPDTESQFKEDMYIAAASSARSIMDFNQGGTVTKDMESVIPYINAATQGTRVAVDAFTQRPQQTAKRMLQAGALMASTGIGMSFALFAMFDDDDEDERTISEKILWAYEGISKYQRINSINIVTPMKTDKGEYYVLKIAKTQFLTPITYYMEESIMNTIRHFNDKPLEPQKNVLKNTMWAFNNNVTPVNTQLGSNPLNAGTWMKIAEENLIKNPLGKAAMTYATGYDFFRDQPLDKGSMGKDMPLQLEGIKNDKVEDFYKAYGELVNQSPIRTKAAVESFVTSPDTNPWVGLIYGGAEVIASDKSKTEVFGKYGENTVKSMVKRLKSETSEFSRMLKRREEQKDAIEAVIIKEEKEKAAIDIMARKMLKNEMTVEEAEKQFKAMKMDADKSERMFKRLSEKVRKPDANPQILDIKYSTNDPVVKAYLINTYFPEIDEKTFNMLEENEIWSKAVKEEYFKLKADGK